MERNEATGRQELGLLIRSLWFSLGYFLLLAVYVAGKEISCAQTKTPYLPGWRPWHPFGFVIPQYVVFLVWGLILIWRRWGQPMATYKWSLAGAWLAISFTASTYFIGYWDESCRADFVERDANQFIRNVWFGAYLGAILSPFGSMVGYKICDSGMISDENMMPTLVVFMGCFIGICYVFRDITIPIILFWLLFGLG